MKVIHRYNVEYSKSLEEKLIELNVSFKRKYIEGLMDNIVFELKQGSSQEKELSPFIDIDILNCLTYVEYSKKELDDSLFLIMRPKLQNVEIINRDESLKSVCSEIDKFNIVRTYHVEQIDEFKVKYSLKNTTYLYSIDTGFSYIFANQKFYELVNKHEIKGINFKHVSTNKEKVCSEFYQVESSNIIKFTDINTEKHCKVRECKICKKKSIVVDELFQLKLNLGKKELEEDFYMTEQIFGEGIPERYYIISQKLYKLLVEEHMDKNVAFIPIILK